MRGLRTQSISRTGLEVSGVNEVFDATNDLFVSANF